MSSIVPEQRHPPPHHHPPHPHPHPHAHSHSHPHPHPIQPGPPPPHFTPSIGHIAPPGPLYMSNQPAPPLPAPSSSEPAPSSAAAPPPGPLAPAEPSAEASGHAPPPPPPPPPGPPGPPGNVLPNIKPPSTAAVDNGRMYSLDVVQQPVRARMCGFGDKDRRPITPPPCVRLIVKDANTGKEVDISEIDISYYVLTVDLWSPDAQREVNLVRHSANSSSITSAVSASYPPTLPIPLTATYMAYHSQPQPPPPPPPQQQQQYPPQYAPPRPQMPYHQPSGYHQPPPPPPPTGYHHPQHPPPPPQGYHHPQHGPPPPPQPVSPYHHQAPPPPPPPPAAHPHAPHYAHPHHPHAPPQPYYQASLVSQMPSPDYYQPQLPSAHPPQAPAATGMFTRNLIGSLSASAFRLTDPDNKIGVWFILQDLSVRTEGQFRLKMNFVNVGNGNKLNTGSAPVLASTFSDVFQVFSAKKFPGVIESTALSKCFATQGIKIPIRKDGPKNPVNRDEYDNDD